jgi:hypothetical protein
MPPDSPSFLQQVISAFQLVLQRFREPDQWNLEVISGIILAILPAIGTVVVAIWRYWRRRRIQRILQKDPTTKLYGEETIKNATRYYIQPNCSSVDPTQEAELRHVVAVKANVFETVDEYLAKDSPQRHLFLLADSGMGKSSFVLNYYARNQRLPKRKRHQIVVLPLVIPDVLERIAQIDDKQNTVLFLDAFDEDTKAIADHKTRLLELMDACKDFRRVLITCRTQFFPSDEEIPVRTGIFRFEPRRASEPAEYEFWIIYLTPFDDQQVTEYLRKRFTLWKRNRRKKAYEIVQKIPLLSVRPMLLAHIPDVMNSEKKVEYSFQLYEIMVESWLERESYWINANDLCAFSERLATDLYTKSQERGTERIPYSELSLLAKGWDIKLEDWQIRGRSLLTQNRHPDA